MQIKISFLLSFQAYVDKAFNREILELDVKCNNHEWGCKWEGEFQNAQVCGTHVTIKAGIVNESDFSLLKA